MTFWVKGVKQNVFVTYAEDKGNYGIVRFNASRIDKKTDKKVKSFYNGWRMVGQGFEGFDKLVERVKNAPNFEGSDKKMGVMITIKSFSFSQEPYTVDNEIKFPQAPQFVIWDWDFYSKDGEGGKQGMDTPPVVEEDVVDWGSDEDEETPFGTDEDDE